MELLIAASVLICLCCCCFPFIHLAVPFVVDWSPSVCCEGPPRIAHALSAAAASALQPRAYAKKKQTKGAWGTRCGYTEGWNLKMIFDSVPQEPPNHNLSLWKATDKIRLGFIWIFPCLSLRGGCVCCSGLAIPTSSRSLWGNWTQCIWMTISCRWFCILMRGRCSQFVPLWYGQKSWITTGKVWHYETCLWAFTLRDRCHPHVSICELRRHCQQHIPQNVELLLETAILTFQVSSSRLKVRRVWYSMSLFYNVYLSYSI